MKTLDKIVVEFDQFLRTVCSEVITPYPRPDKNIKNNVNLTDQEKKLSGNLIRVNHSGEVCAQALYRGQMMQAQTEKTYQALAHACEEEIAHLVWTKERLDELGSRPSVLNALWYIQSFSLGYIMAWMGDSISLAYVVETEKQVEAHLTDHLERLPASDKQSAAILEQMRLDEIEHGQAAQDLGAATLPLWYQSFMTLQSRLMTTLSFYL